MSNVADKAICAEWESLVAAANNYLLVHCHSRYMPKKDLGLPQAGSGEGMHAGRCRP